MPGKRRYSQLLGLTGKRVVVWQSLAGFQPAPAQGCNPPTIQRASVSLLWCPAWGGVLIIINLDPLIFPREPMLTPDLGRAAALGAGYTDLIPPTPTIPLL
jgi:hypothetical protein